MVFKKNGKSIIKETPGQDRLIGTGGDDTLIGGAGDDYLEGGPGNDTYIWNLGDGNDTINNYSYYGSQDTDTLKFGEGIRPEDVELTRSKYDLYITIRSTGERITVKDGVAYAAWASYLNRIEFADGTVWTHKEMQDSSVVWHGTDGDDQMEGDSRDDTINGGAGNDKLYGDRGDDTLQIEFSDGTVWTKGMIDSWLKVERPKKSMSAASGRASEEVNGFEVIPLDLPLRGASAPWMEAFRSHSAVSGFGRGGMDSIASPNMALDSLSQNLAVASLQMDSGANNMVLSSYSADRADSGMSLSFSHGAPEKSPLPGNSAWSRRANGLAS